MSGEAANPVAWLRAQVEADLAAARIINAGGFSPQRWDTEPPGQVNPDDIPQSDAVTAALGCEPEYICGWVQLIAYDKLNNEPDEAYGRDSGAPFALVDNGRREFEHIIRHDPRNVVADCEAKLAILGGLEEAMSRGESPEEGGWHDGRDPDERERDEALADFAEQVLLTLADGYKHRGGWGRHFACDRCGKPVREAPAGHTCR